MRRALGALLVVLAWCVAADVSAQNIELGIHAGVNVAGTPTFSSLAAEARNGIILGGSASFELAPPFRLAVEAQYVQHGIQFTNASTTGLPASGAPTDIYNISYLEIPVNLRIGFGSRFQVYGLAGTNVGTLLSATHQVNRADGGSEEIDNKEALTSTNFALELGGGVSYGITSRMSVAVDGRYSFGLNDVEEAAASESLLNRDSWKPTGMKLTTGLNIRL